MFRKLTRWIRRLPSLLRRLPSPQPEKMPADSKRDVVPWLWLQTPGLGLWRAGIF